MLVHNSLHLILNFIGNMFLTNQVLATSCQVYPSEYAYRDDSVNRAESTSANCRRYPAGHVSQQHYIHCDGTQLKLTDSNFGQEQYQGANHYGWIAGSDAHLLFIFSTNIPLTTIILHYYSDSHRGLPRLRLYAVPDDIEVWDTVSTSYPHVDVAAVPPGGEPAGRRNININDINFNTKKVLMYKFSSSFQFSVSEVEFITCEGITTSTSGIQPTSSIPDNTATLPEGPTTATNFTTTNLPTKSMRTPSSSTTDPMSVVLQSNSATEITVVGVSIALLLVLSTILIVIVSLLVWSYKRRSAKQSLLADSSYSMLSRGCGQQIQPQSIQHNSAQLYDQIHLSPSTGQTEFISKSENANINNPSQTLQNSHPTYSTTGDNRAEHSTALTAVNQVTTSQLSSQKTHESTCEQPTYAAVNKSKKKKIKKQTKKEDPNCTAAEKGPPISPYRHEVSSASMEEKKETVEKQESCSSHTIEELYTAVKKKPKGSEPKDEEETPPIPPHTVEELYTAVEKKPKSITDENKDEAPPQRVLQNMTEVLYTTVMKSPKDGSTEPAPPIPPHTVEELYTAVMKKPKESTKDEEEAPPIRPYTVGKINS